MLCSNYIAAGIAQVNGHALYNAADSADQYSMFYGSATFWLFLPPLLLGHDLRLFEIWVMIPLCITQLCCAKLTMIVPNSFGRAFVLLQTATLLIVYSRFETAMRADVWILCFMSLQVFAAVFLERWWTMLAEDLAVASYDDRSRALREADRNYATCGGRDIRVAFGGVSVSGKRHIGERLSFVVKDQRSAWSRSSGAVADSANLAFSFDVRRCSVLAST